MFIENSSTFEQLSSHLDTFLWPGCFQTGRIYSLCPLQRSLGMKKLLEIYTKNKFFKRNDIFEYKTPLVFTLKNNSNNSVVSLYAPNASLSDSSVAISGHPLSHSHAKTCPGKSTSTFQIARVVEFLANLRANSTKHDLRCLRLSF